jgi:hypothetical protein
VRSWQGVQKIPKRSWPRATSSRVSGTGSVVASSVDAMGAAPGGTGAASEVSMPRATVPSTSGRDARPSAKNPLF